MECWLALGNFATDKTRLILAGDPRLLGPVCTTQVLSGFGLKKSLLHRLISIENIENDPRQMIQLTYNYRSHPAIVEFISSNFYDDTLVAMNNTSCCTLPFLPNPGFPLMFHNVNGKQRKENNTWANIPEAKVVIDYVRKCINAGYKPEEIGVVSPYKYQGKIIRSRLKNSKVTVETVEKFQGSERKIIIITTTRIKRLGFVAEDLRFNTSVSRGKDLVILVGKEAALSKFSWFKNFIDACRNNSSTNAGGGEDDIEISEEEDNVETSEGDGEDGTWEMLENLRIY
uniref:DNA2/NAM7 helicase-like C-terminal domain-containing protein n=1 Tax=Panagrolaimus davidi TaxID=227884 RepID=A0A914PI87_9BILA